MTDQLALRNTPDWWSVDDGFPGAVPNRPCCFFPAFLFFVLLFLNTVQIWILFLNTVQIWIYGEIRTIIFSFTELLLEYLVNRAKTIADQFIQVL